MSDETFEEEAADEQQPSTFPSFEEALSGLINRYSLENESNTADFILANYMVLCLEAYTSTVKQRDEFDGEKR